MIVSSPRYAAALCSLFRRPLIEVQIASSFIRGLTRLDCSALHRVIHHLSTFYFWRSTNGVGRAICRRDIQCEGNETSERIPPYTLFNTASPRMFPITRDAQNVSRTSNSIITLPVIMCPSFRRKIRTRGGSVVPLASRLSLDPDLRRTALRPALRGRGVRPCNNTSRNNRIAL